MEEKKKRKTTTKKSTSTRKKSTSTKKSTTVKKKTTAKKTTTKKTTTPKSTTTIEEVKIKRTPKDEITDKKQSYQGPILKKKEKKSFKELIKGLPKIIGLFLLNFIKNIPKYLKSIAVGVKLIIVKIVALIIFIFASIFKFIKFIFNKLKELDKKDEERKNKKKEKKYNKQDELYNTKKFDLKLLEDDIDRDQLELVPYKGHKNKIGVFFENRGRVLKFDMKKFNKRLKYGTLRDKILIVLMLFLIFIFACAIFLITYVVITAPNIDKDRLYKENSTVLYDKDGNEFARIGSENREKVTYDELPQVLVDAIVATEDSRFFQHNGIDVARFIKASFGQILGSSGAGGASTLTMQLSKNSATSNEAHGLKGIIRKFQDIYLAVFVYEKKYTKEQIMEFYVNNGYLGAAYGVQQASRAYFGKDVSDLNLSEAAMIAGLFQLPFAYNPYNHPVAAENRRNTVLNLMERHGYISKEEKEAAQAIPIKSLLAGYNSELNEHIRFIDTVVEEVVRRTGYDPYTTSMEIYTTMDPAQQKVVNDIQNGVTYKYKNDYSENGIAVISIETGAITSIGTGRSKKSERSFNYATDGRRHPGSTAKPVVDYGPAIEYLGWGTGNTVIDKQYEYTGGGKIKNWNNTYEGAESIKDALARSRNIPALLTFKQTSNEQKLKMASDLGWTLETSGDQILETCSIGGFTGVTPVESAAAYAAFARGGTYIEPYSFTKVVFNETGDEFVVTPKRVQAMSEETAYIITNILQYAISSGVVGGITNKPGAEVASKTGTSTVDGNTIKKLNLKGAIDGDVWQVAYTQDYAMSMWYSYPTLTSEHYLTSSEGSAARRGIMKELTKGIITKKSSFNRPSGVTTATIEKGTDPVQLASEFTPADLKSVEMYNKNSVPTETSNRFAQLNNPSNLKYNANGTQIYLTWDGIPTPDAVSEAYIRDYFTKSSIYSYWAEEYIAERIAYNNAHIGNFGYEIYITDGAGTRSLGFVTDTNFTYNGYVANGSTFTVKSSYSIFKANQSKGITVTIGDGNSSGTDVPSGDGKIVLSLRNPITIGALKNAMAQNNMFSLAYSIKTTGGEDLKVAGTTLYLSCSAGRNDQCLSEIESHLANNESYNATFYVTRKNFQSTNQQTKITRE